MAFVDKSNTKKIYAYLTKQGREKILTGNTIDFIVTKFSLHDDDVNYLISANKVNSEYNLLPSGFIPDVTGDNQECTISVVDQLLRNELFGSVPPPRIPLTGCGDPTAINYNSNLNPSNGDVIDNRLCTYPPPQPLNLTDVRGQCELEPFKYKISVNNIDGGTQPYKWYVQTNFGDNNSAPFNTLRNEGDSFIFDTPQQGNATFTVKVEDSGTPKQTAEKQFTNVSCQPVGPFIKISGTCSEDWEYNSDALVGVNNLPYPNRPAWRYNLKIEYVTPQKPWAYMIVSKALSPSTPTGTDFNHLDGLVWDEFVTRPGALPVGQSSPFGNVQRRYNFNNTNNPLLTQTIELPGNIGKPVDYQVIFFDTTLNNTLQETNRITAFTVSDILCAPRKLRLKVIKLNKPSFYNFYGPSYVTDWGSPNAYFQYSDTPFTAEAYASWVDIQTTSYIDPDIVPTRVMKFERFTQDHGFLDVNKPGYYSGSDPTTILYRTTYNLKPDTFPLEIAIPFYIAYDELGNDYEDIYLFNKSNIPQDLKVQFRTVGSFNKDRIKFPTGIGPNIDWTEDSSGRMVSPEYTLSDSSIEQSWTYNGRQQKPIFRRFDYSTAPTDPNTGYGPREDGYGHYYLNFPGQIDGCEGIISVPDPSCYDDFNISNPAQENFEPQPNFGANKFRGTDAEINTYLAGTTVTELGAANGFPWGRPRECIVYRYILPIRFSPNTNGTGQGRTKLDLEVEMICNHPDISPINYYNYGDNATPKIYSSNTFKIQLDVPVNQV